MSKGDYVRITHLHRVNAGYHENEGRIGILVSVGSKTHNMTLRQLVIAFSSDVHDKTIFWSNEIELVTDPAEIAATKLMQGI